MIESIGAKLKRHRLTLGLKQEELCSGICSVSQLSKIETGKAEAKPEQLEAFAKRFGITIEVLQSHDSFRDEMEQSLKLTMQLCFSNQYEQSIHLLDGIVKQSFSHGYFDIYAEAVFQLSRNHEFLRNWEDVKHYAETLLALDHDMDPVRTMELWGQLGFAHANSGNLAKAYECYAQEERFIDFIQEDHPLAFRVFLSYGNHQFKLRNYREVRRFAEKALRIANEQKKHIARWRMSNVIAISMNKLGEDREHRYELLMNSLNEAELNSALFDAAISAGNLGTLHLSEGNLSKARHYSELGVKYLECLTGSYQEFAKCEMYYDLAIISIRESQFERTEQLLCKLQAICTKKLDMFQFHARIEAVRAELSHQQGRGLHRVKHLQAALEIYDHHTMYLDAYDTAVVLAEAYEERSDFTAALEMYRKAIEYSKKFEKTRLPMASAKNEVLHKCISNQK